MSEVIGPAILFDLDGTLADTAPDLCGALNQLLVERGRPPVPLARTRRHTSSGARGMIAIGFGIGTEDLEYPDLRDRFMELYGQRLTQETRLFEGIELLLSQMDEAGIPWGVVTNKIARLTEPLLQSLGVRQRARVVVSGDTTAHTKPHPAPLLFAAESIGVDPSRCFYIGDDYRDVKAAHSAGMRAVVALYGYLGDDLPPERWGGDASIHHPRELPRTLRELG
jgi:2-phosphoglycolate phosphatase